MSKYIIIDHDTAVTSEVNENGRKVVFNVQVESRLKPNGLVTELYNELKNRIQCPEVKPVAKIITPMVRSSGTESKSCKPFPLGIDIKEVKFEPPYTIVLWEDGLKTKVKCRKGDVYNKEMGLALCIIKRALGNRWGYYNIFKHWIPELKKVKNYAKEDSYEVYCSKGPDGKNVKEIHESPEAKWEPFTKEKVMVEEDHGLITPGAIIDVKNEEGHKNEENI